MSFHTDNERIKLSQTLAHEALKLEQLCKEGEKDDRILEYQLSQVAQLARQVTADVISYDEKEDQDFFG